MSFLKKLKKEAMELKSSYDQQQKDQKQQQQPATPAPATGGEEKNPVGQPDVKPVVPDDPPIVEQKSGGEPAPVEGEKTDKYGKHIAMGRSVSDTLMKNKKLYSSFTKSYKKKSHGGGHGGHESHDAEGGEEDEEEDGEED